MYDFALAVALAGLLADASGAGAAELPQRLCHAQRTAVVIQKGNIESGNLTGSFEQTIDLLSGRYVAARDFGVFSQGEGFDGRRTWARDRSGASHALNSDPAMAISTSEAWVRRRGWCKEEAPGERLPDEIDNGATEVVWRVTPKGGTPVILRFSQTGGELRQSEIRLWGSRLIRHFEDWRDTGGGILMPYTERNEYPEDESIATIKITSLRVSDRAVGPMVFMQPPRPKDYAILGGAPSTSVPYEDDGIGEIFVPVYIDGNGPFAFEVDTGGHLILTKETASRLHLNAVGSFNGTGGGQGIVKQGFVRTEEIRIGSAVMRNQPAKVVPLSVASNDRGERLPRGGILGLELFERFAVKLDRRAKTMTLTPLDSFRRPKQGVALPITFTEDAPMSKGTFEGVSGDFELDSGDSGPAIIEGYWATQHGLEKKLSQGLNWSGAGVGGEYQEVLSRGAFTLGSVKLPHEIVSYVGLVQRGSESTQLQAGLVGESSLYRFDMTFDYARGFVWMNPVPIAPLRPFNRSGLRIRKETPDRVVAAIVLPDSPAQLAGIEVGDQIVSIDGKPLSNTSTTDVSILLSGPVGSERKLLILPKNGATEHAVTIVLKELLP